MHSSVDGVEPQFAFLALVMLIGVDRLEYGAAGHLAGVDVQADGHFFGGVADGVVLVRRDQAAGGAGAGDRKSVV